MSSDVPIPPRPLGGIGPGSQPDDGEEFSFMQMPRGMFRHDLELGSLPEPEDVANLRNALEVVGRLRDATASYRCGESAVRVDMDGLSRAELDFIAQLMGEGEVSIRVEPAPDAGAPDEMLMIQESVMTGIWQVRRTRGDDPSAAALEEWLEVGDIPSAVMQSRPDAFDLPTDAGPLPEGVMTAPALLTEIADHLLKRKLSGGEGEPHEINLTLLPVTDADLIMLGERLGVGPVTILSRGYGNCRIGSTKYRDVWWIKFYNSQDALILNTIQIVAVPEVALAAPEDIEASAERLAEIAELYGI